jgi:GntR family transcriptional regulator of arabinose operon
MSLALRLETYLSSMPNGAKLPTMRTIASRYGASMVTLGSALDRLEKKGLVVRRHGSGVFVSRKDGVKRLALLRNDFVSSVSDARVQAMHEVCHEEAWALTVVQTSTFYPDDFADLKGDYEGIILEGDAVPKNSIFFQSLLKRGTPLVKLGSVSDQVGIDSVENDDYHGMGLIFKHLHEIGHRKVALLLSEYPQPSVIFRKSAFESFSRIFDMEGSVIDCGVQSGQESSSAVISTLASHLEDYTSRRPFTAIVAISDIGALAALRSLHTHGISTEQCHVTGFDNTLIGSLCVPSLTTLSWDTKEMGRRCINLVKRRIEGDTTPNLREQVPPSLVIRESTSSPIAS